jgi:hypothetical protein
MTKRVEITGTLLELLRAKTGDDNFDVTKVVAYESIAASTRPIKKTYSPYDKAVMAESVLTEAAAILASGSVPLLTLHNGSMLPVGQCLDAGVVSADGGHSELRVIFYLEATDELVGKLDLGIIDEVSVGMLAQHAYCSECSFDYLLPENIYNFWMRNCENDHTLGQDGVHLRLSGCNSWGELSLVPKGASNNAKIVNRAQQRLSNESYQKLAASGGHPDLVYLLCSSSEAPQDKSSTLGDNHMELTALIGDLTNARAEVMTLTATKTSLEAAGLAMKTENDELKASLDTVTAELTTLKANDAVTKLTTVELELTSVSEFVKKNWEMALKATGKEVPAETPTSADMIAQLEAAQVQLAAIPRNGVSHGLNNGESGIVNLQAQAQASAFQSKK